MEGFFRVMVTIQGKPKLNSGYEVLGQRLIKYKKPRQESEINKIQKTPPRVKLCYNFFFTFPCTVR